MPVLHMETMSVRSTAEQFQRVTADVEANAQQLNAHLNHLSNNWHGVASDMFVNQMSHELARAQTVANEGLVLAGRLRAEVDEWEMTDARFGAGLPSLDHVHYGSVLTYTVWPAGAGGLGAIGGFSGGGGGGGGGGGWGAEAGGIETSIDSEYLLIRGHQIELFSRYREGEMTFDEVMKQLEEVEKSTHPDYFQAKATIWELERRHGEASVDWQSNTISGKYGTIDASVLRAAAEGESYAEINTDGLVAGVAGAAGLYLVHGTASSQMAGIDMTGQAYLGAQVAGKSEVKLNPLSGDVSASAGVEAFAGAKAEGSAKWTDVGVEGVDIEAKGAAMAGAGIVGEVDIGLDDGVIKMDADLGAALGIGAQIGFTTEINVIEAGQDVARTGWDVINWAL